MFLLILFEYLQGGGWCNTIRNCVYRKNTHRGSSKYMENQIPFTGILSNKPEENPGFSLYPKGPKHACIFLPIVELISRFNLWILSLCSVIFLDIIFHVQISLTGTESNYGTVMGHLLVEIVKMRSVKVVYHILFDFIYIIAINSPSYFHGRQGFCRYIQSI